MIKFYYNTAPNPTKVALGLEEMGLPYELVPVDTRKGEQHTASFLAINPNAKVPAIVDDGVTVFDSNAILLYLAEKTGKFLPGTSLAARGEMFSWLMFVASGIGPYSGQAVHFRNFAPEPKDYAVNRYTCCPTCWGRMPPSSCPTCSVTSPRSAPARPPCAPWRSRTSTPSRRRWTRPPAWRCSRILRRRSPDPGGAWHLRPARAAAVHGRRRRENLAGVLAAQGNAARLDQRWSRRSPEGGRRPALQNFYTARGYTSGFRSG
jgi:hypothetical protein